MPLFYRIFLWFKRRLGREKFQARIELAIRLTLSGNKPTLESVLRRVMARSGAPPSPEALKAALDGMVSIYAQTMACMAMDRPEAQERAQGVRLDLLPVLRRLQDKKRGVILAGPHFGNVNVGITALGLAGVPLHVVFISGAPYRQAGRQFGVKVFDLGQSAAACVAALARNEVVLLYTDLDFFPGNRTADFFGAPIRPPHGPARLSLYTGAPILPVYFIHEKQKARFVADEAIFPENKSVPELEAAILRSMERFIARHPDHWWLCKDIWDLEAVDRENRRRRNRLELYRKLSAWLPRLS